MGWLVSRASARKLLRGGLVPKAQLLFWTFFLERGDLEGIFLVVGEGEFFFEGWWGFGR